MPTDSFQVFLIFSLLILSFLTEAEAKKDKDKDDGKKKKDKDDKRVKAKPMKLEVKNQQWPEIKGREKDFLMDVAHLEFMNKWQPFADKVSKEIGQKSKNDFPSKGLCSKEYKCETITNISTAKIDKDIKNPAKKLMPISMKSMDKFMTALTKDPKYKKLKLDHEIQKGLVWATEVHHAGIVVRFSEFKKQEMAGEHAAGLAFDAFKLIIMKGNPTAIRGVIAQTDGQPAVMRAFCAFPKGSNRAQADSFCKGNDAFEEDEDEEDDDKKDKDKDKDKDDDKDKDKKKDKDKDDDKDKKKDKDKDDDKDKNKKKDKGKPYHILLWQMAIATFSTRSG